MKTLLGRLVKYHRTKPAVLLAWAGLGVFIHFGYSGPSSDRRFAVGCVVVLGVILALALLKASVLRCPRCRADMGRFDALPLIHEMGAIGHPRYVACKYCDCVVDRHRGNRVVADGERRQGIP